MYIQGHNNRDRSNNDINNDYYNNNINNNYHHNNNSTPCYTPSTYNNNNNIDNNNNEIPPHFENRDNQSLYRNHEHVKNTDDRMNTDHQDRLQRIDINQRVYNEYYHRIKSMAIIIGNVIRLNIEQLLLDTINNSENNADQQLQQKDRKVTITTEYNKSQNMMRNNGVVILNPIIQSMELSFSVSPDCKYLYYESRVGRLPPSPSNNLLIKLMKLSEFSLNGGHIGLSDDGKEVHCNGVLRAGNYTAERLNDILSLHFAMVSNLMDKLNVKRYDDLISIDC